MNKGQTLILQTTENEKTIYKKAEITYVWKDSNKYNIQFEDGSMNSQIHLYPSDENSDCIICTTDLNRTQNTESKTTSSVENKSQKKTETVSQHYTKKPYSCNQCNHVARNSRDLELHQWQEHPSNEYERAWASRKGSRGGFYDDDPYY